MLLIYSSGVVFTETSDTLTMNGRHYVIVPSPVTNVTASVRTPTAVNVTWRSPDQPNGPVTDLRYIVDWQTVNKDGSQSNGQVDVVRGMYSVLLKNLRSSQRYQLKVRSSSVHL